MEYLLEVEGSTSHSQVANTPSKNFNSVGNLLHDQMYMFRVTVSNAVGNVYTSYNKICESQNQHWSCMHDTRYYTHTAITDTTNIQTITAVPHRDTNKFMLKCTFATGSPAWGCRAVFISESRNISSNLTRSNNSKHIYETLNLSQPLYCYSQLLGYDNIMEFDVSIGSLHWLFLVW